MSMKFSFRDRWAIVASSVTVLLKLVAEALESFSRALSLSSPHVLLFLLILFIITVVVIIISFKELGTGFQSPCDFVTTS